MKKYMAMLLVLVMLVSAMGCANSSVTPPSAADTATPAPAETAEPTEPVGEDLLPNNIPQEVLDNVLFKVTPEALEYAQKTDPVTLSIFYNAVVAGAWTWGEDPVTAKIQELTGVTLEGSYAADTEGNQLTLMIAGGDTLPDIISSVNPTSTHLNELISGELIYPINQLIDEYCPKMWDVLFPFETTYYNDENGNMWYLGKQAIIPHDKLNDYTIANGWYAVRQDAYEALGSPSLATPDDVLAYLDLYKQRKDEFPEITYPWMDTVLMGGGNISVAYAMLGGIALYSGGSTFCYDKDTKSVYTLVDTELGKQALHFYYELAQAGYITQQSFALENTTDELSAGKALIYARPNVWDVDAANANLAQNLPDASYERILPIHAPGVDYHYYDTAFRAAVTATVITKDCADPERAILFFEFMATEYGNLLGTSGIYGEHWEYTTLPNGNLGIQFIGEAATDTATRTELGIYNHSKIWWTLTTNYDLAATYSTRVDDTAAMEISQFVKRDSASTAPNFITLAADSDEFVLRNQITEIIDTYVTKIILAKDEAAFNTLYDEMIAALYSSGLESLQDTLAQLSGEYVNRLAQTGFVWAK